MRGTIGVASLGQLKSETRFCVGGCGHAFRPQGSPARDFPGTRIVYARGMCHACWFKPENRAARAESGLKQRERVSATQPHEFSREERIVDARLALRFGEDPALGQVREMLGLVSL